MFFELGRSFEVSAQQEELRLAQEEEGWTVSVFLVLLSRKTAERTPKTPKKNFSLCLRFA